MTARIREFLKQRTEDGPCLVVDLDVVRENYLGFAKSLPDTKVFYAVKANPAPEILKLLAGLGCCFDVASVSETAGRAGRRRDARAHLLRQHDQERDRDRRGLPARRHALCRRLRGRGREGRARRARQPGDLPHPLRRLRRRMAAVAQVRLRAGLCRRHSGACAQARAWSRTACPSMSARSSTTSKPGTARSPRRRRYSAPAPSAASRSPMVNLGGGFPARYVRKTPKLESYGKAIFRSLRKHFGNNLPETIVEPGRGPRRQCRRDRGRGGADRQALARGRGALGLSRHRQIPRAGRDHRRVDPLSDPHHARIATRPRPASSPARPATRSTCCTRRRPTRCRSRSPSATRC